MYPVQFGDYRIVRGSCETVLRTLPENTFDAIICDPPYGLRFMGKGWDHGVPVRWIKHAFYALKPGGYLIAFGGTRTYHRLAVAIEDAGFELRDCLMWLYGQGFPKSMDVSKAIDKAAGATREVIGQYASPEGTTGIHSRDDDFGFGMGDMAKRMITAPATDAARKWDGWGTALKPSWEPIILARKPLSKSTVAANVLHYGTGALNINATRIGTDWATDPTRRGWQGRKLSHDGGAVKFVDHNKHLSQPNAQGRWPANLVLSHAPGCVRVGTQRVTRPGGSNRLRSWRVMEHRTDRPVEPKAITGKKETIDVWACVPQCPIRLLDTQTGKLVSGAGNFRRKKHATIAMAGSLGEPRKGVEEVSYGDTGGASRFFYTSKAARKERFAYCVTCKVAVAPDQIAGHKKQQHTLESHPTQKPLALMRWLVRLVAPPGALICDPFVGSGTTVCAAVSEGVRIVGIDQSKRYVRIARARAFHHSVLDE